MKQNLHDQVFSLCTPHPLWHDQLDTQVRPLGNVPPELAANSRWPVRVSDEPIPYTTNFVGDLGSSGLNMGTMEAEFATFEFDLDHGNQQSPESLDEIIQKSGGLFEVCQSTGGLGLHCRVRLSTPVPVEARRAYGGLCRFIVKTLGDQIDIPDLLDRCCAVGCILWFYSHRATDTSFKVLSEQTQPFDVPEDWTPPPTKTRQNAVEPTEHHDRILNALDALGCLDPWEGGFSTHTSAIAEVWHELGLLGPFATATSGSTDRNCYLIPKENGSFFVGRYGNATEPTWPDNHTFLNQFDPKRGRDRLVIQFAGTRRDPTRGNQFVMPLSNVHELVRHLGGYLEPLDLEGDAIITFGDGHLTIEVTTDASPFGWHRVGKKLKTSLTIHHVKPDRSVPVLDKNAMNGIRCGVRVTSPDSPLDTGGGLAYYVRQKEGSWVVQSKDDVRTILQGRGCNTPEINKHLGECLTDLVKITNVPFVDEVEGSWNRGTKLSCVPKPGPHPHWNKILDHLGKDLDGAVAADSWCVNSNVKTGRDYLFLWCSVMFQQPERRIPYLYFWSLEQATGKSSLAATLALLFDSAGVCDAGQAFKSDGGFNSEIENAVLCKVEELDLGSSQHAYSKLKQWVTEPVISIHKKGSTPYNARNYTHWIQTSNSLSSVPISFGDERVVVVQVDSLSNPLDWATELQPALTNERAGFLHSLLNTDLPDPCGRLFLPILTTDSKQRLIEESLPQLTDHQQEWLDKIGDGWVGMKTLPEIYVIIGGRPHNASWKSSWQKMAIHFHSIGLKPITTPGSKHVKATYGFEQS